MDINNWTCKQSTGRKLILTHMGTL
jgi:hypothetical protein